MGELQTSLDGFFKKSPAIQTFSEEEYVDKRKANIFSYLTDICFEKTGTIPEEYDFEMKGWSSFMVLRYLSLYEPYLPIINIFNYYQGTLTPLQLYKALLVVIPKGKRFLKYPKLQDELNNDSIIEFANELGIHRAIVAGKIRREANNYMILTDMVGQGEVRKLFPDVYF